ncbi:biotin/lipoyl-binding protein [Vibrio sp. PP-XX7]
MTTENTPQAQPASSKARSRKKGLFLFGLILCLIAGSVTTWYYLFEMGHISTEDAYVEGNLVQITPQVVGTVTQIAADDGDYIKKGQEVIRFDSSDADIELQTAKANLAQTVRQVRSLFNNVEQAKAVVAQKQIAFNKAQTDYRRRQEMVKAGGLSQEDLSHAKDMVDSAEKALAVSIQQRRSQEAMTYNTDVASHPLVQTAAEKVRKAYLDQQRTRLVAPVSGYIARRNVQVGQRVNPGTALMAVVPLEQVWVNANFKRNSAGRDADWPACDVGCGSVR